MPGLFPAAAAEPTEPTDPTDPPQTAEPTPPPPRRRWRPRRLHIHLSLWTLVLAGLVALALVLSSMAVTGRVVVLPAWVTARVTDELNAALPGGQISLARVEAGVTPAGRPKLRLVGVGLSDATGLSLAQLNAVEIGLSRRAVFTGEIVPSHVALQGAQLTLRRLRNGAFDLALAGQMTDQNVGTTGSLGTLLDRLDALFDAGPVAGVAWLGASDLTVSLEDARSGRVLQVTDGSVVITPGPDATETTLRFEVFNQTDKLARSEFSFRSARDSSEASLSLRFDNAAARDIAALAPALSFLSVIEAPISGALDSGLDAEGGLSDLAGTLKIGAGRLAPEPGAAPIGFDGGQISIDFDPARQRLSFTGAELQSEIGALKAQGHVDLAEIKGGWPGSLVGQVDFPGLTLAPPGLFAAPLALDSATADIRLRLDPFRIDIGQAVAERAGVQYRASGALGAAAGGWWVALDAQVAEASRREALAVWPVIAEPAARDWVAQRIDGGRLSDVTLAFRKTAQGKLKVGGSLALADARLRPIDGMAPVELVSGYLSIAPQQVAITAENAFVDVKDEGRLDASGTAYLIPTTPDAPKIATLELALAGPVPAALSVLAGAPFHLFKDKTDQASGSPTDPPLGPDMATGQAVARGQVFIPFTPEEQAKGPPRYDVTATLSDLASDVLIPGKPLRADRLTLQARDTGIEIAGPVRIGAAEASGTWMLPLVPGVELPATVTGTLALTPEALRDFGLGDIAAMVSGRGAAAFDIDLGTGGEAPVLRLSSDLAGLGLELPGTGWRKPADARGAFSLSAILGDRPEVTALTIAAPGLEAGGTITLSAEGGLDQARFERVRLGGWLDAPVTLEGQGDGRPVAIRLAGGTVDLRAADFGSGAAPETGGPSQPLTLALDRLIVTDSIAINALEADLDLAAGLSGRFTGRFFDGNLVEGTLRPSPHGPAIRLSANHAGEVLRQTGIFDKARDGRLDLVLTPAPAPGSYEGEARVSDTRITDAPAMAEMLSAVSLVGLPDTLSGEGIRFDRVDARFRIDPGAVTLYRAAATGPSLGLSLDGYYDMAAAQLDMQGVLSPIYILNGIGRAFSTRDGEGLVGFNFTLKGDAANPSVGVNPLSVLAPGALRDLFRREAPRAPARVARPEGEAANAPAEATPAAARLSAPDWAQEVGSEIGPGIPPEDTRGSTAPAAR